jgi:hypothetical protein
MFESIELKEMHSMRKYLLAAALVDGSIETDPIDPRSRAEGQVSVEFA